MNESYFGAFRVTQKAKILHIVTPNVEKIARASSDNMNLPPCIHIGEPWQPLLPFSTLANVEYFSSKSCNLKTDKNYTTEIKLFQKRYAFAPAGARIQVYGLFDPKYKTGLYFNQPHIQTKVILVYSIFNIRPQYKDMYKILN